MPVSIVVGGQFGSEGKGKVALEIVRRDPSTAAVVRVGGTNSGHTAIGRNGQTYALRQLPASGIDRSALVVLPPGSYIDLELFRKEAASLGFGSDQIAVSPMARVITGQHKEWERASALGAAIGSTQSGTGAAVIASAARGAGNLLLQSVQAEDTPYLQPFLRDTTSILRRFLNDGRRIVVEGTQGFGLSLLQGGYWPKATSRDTTAAGFLAEAGVSPLDVDDITMVIRCHPIRVAGDSGPLKDETTWEQISMEAKSVEVHREMTTVTGKLRRVGRFDADLVRRAIEANNPTRIALNHLDYVDARVRDLGITSRVREMIDQIETAIDRSIDWLGTGPSEVFDRRLMLATI